MTNEGRELTIGFVILIAIAGFYWWAYTTQRSDEDNQSNGGSQFAETAPTILDQGAGNNSEAEPGTDGPRWLFKRIEELAARAPLIEIESIPEQFTGLPVVWDGEAVEVTMLGDSLAYVDIDVEGVRVLFELPPNHPDLSLLHRGDSVQVKATISWIRVSRNSVSLDGAQMKVVRRSPATVD